MTPADRDLHTNRIVADCRALHNRVRTALLAGGDRASLEPACLEMAHRARQIGRSDLAVALLSPYADSGAASADLLASLAVSLREEHAMEAALRTMERAAALAPRNPRIALAHAQLAQETWRPAATLFRKAAKLAPGEPEVARGLASALAAQGDVAGAVKTLERALRTRPGWIDGHRQLTTHRVLSGRTHGVDDSFRAACAARPRDLPLRLAWFHALAHTRDWAAARAVIEAGEATLGPQRGFLIARAFLAAESGDDDAARAAFAQLEAVEDPGLDLCRVRFFARCGDVERAEVIAARHIGRASARSFWPYLSLIWRLLGDDRAAWLDRDAAFIRSLDLAITPNDLDALAARLRSLHTSVSPHREQSVRGGTQTDRHLFFNPAAEIQAIRAAIAEGVRAYIADLPAPDPRHPLLGLPREDIRVQGAWSVRLAGHGRHAMHTHTAGWISSAFYVASPRPEALGAPPAGWISFGQGPPELGLKVREYARIAPEPGRLVLFPSTMWHGTYPYDAGERLTIAFDVAPPRRRHHGHGGVGSAERGPHQ